MSLTLGVSRLAPSSLYSLPFVCFLEFSSRCSCEVCCVNSRVPAPSPQGTAYSIPGMSISLRYQPVRDLPTALHQRFTLEGNGQKNPLAMPQHSPWVIANFPETRSSRGPDDEANPLPQYCLVDILGTPVFCTSIFELLLSACSACLAARKQHPLKLKPYL